MTLPVGNLGTRFGEGKMAFETTRLRRTTQGGYCRAIAIDPGAVEKLPWCRQGGTNRDRA
jgi:hypothetical protein